VLGYNRQKIKAVTHDYSQLHGGIPPPPPAAPIAAPAASDGGDGDGDGGGDSNESAPVPADLVPSAAAETAEPAETADEGIIAPVSATAKVNMKED
jgi:hypothetical protein